MLASRLSEIMPGDLSCVMYSVGDGEANDYAIKLARGETGKSKIIAMGRAYQPEVGKVCGQTNIPCYATNENKLRADVFSLRQRRHGEF